MAPIFGRHIVQPGEENLTAVKKGSAKERAARREMQRRRAIANAVEAEAHRQGFYLCVGANCPTPFRQIQPWNNHMCDICQAANDRYLCGDWNEMSDKERRKVRGVIHELNYHLPYERPKEQVNFFAFWKLRGKSFLPSPVGRVALPPPEVQNNAALATCWLLGLDIVGIARGKPLHAC